MTREQIPRPKSAFLAVTLLCNSRCVMCDIWQNKGLDYLPLEIYRKLPDSLEMIDITGGEPFLRPDIPELAAVLHETCPKARLLITTHGFMTEKIENQLEALLKADPGIAFRVSLDGLGKVHEEIRRIPQAFEKVLETLALLQKNGVKDLGIIFTLMKQKRGDIVNISSLSGLIGIPGQTNYSASKGGMISFTRSLAKEIAPFNIRVNAIAPGFIETEMVAGLDPKKTIDLIPMKRLGKPEEVAEVVNFLLKKEAGYITGQVIQIDGGLGI